MDELRPEGGQAVIRRAGRRWLRPSTLWFFVLSGLAVLSLAATLPLSLLSRQLGNGIVALVIGVPCAGVGIVVARRQPGNPLGWLYLLIASCLFLATDGGDYSAFAYPVAIIFSSARWDWSLTRRGLRVSPCSFW